MSVVATVFSLGNQIVFPDARIAWCRRHLAPFEAEWPHGYLALCVHAFEVITREERFASHMPTTVDGTSVLDEDLATKLLQSFSPICEWLGEDVMTMLTNEALAAVPKP